MLHNVNNCSDVVSPSPEAAQSLMMIVTTKPDEEFGNFSAKVREYNKAPPFKFAEPEIFKTFVRVRLFLKYIFS